MLSYDGSENMVYHGLESCQQIRESEEHNCRFVESILCLEGGFVLITLLDAHVVVPPLNYQVLCKYGCLVGRG